MRLGALLGTGAQDDVGRERRRVLADHRERLRSGCARLRQDGRGERALAAMRHDDDLGGARDRQAQRQLVRVQGLRGKTSPRCRHARGVQRRPESGEDHRT